MQNERILHDPAASRPSEYLRTDLACESGVEPGESEEEVHRVGSLPVTVTRRREIDGGRSVTLACGRITARGEEELEPLSELLARELRDMAAAMTGRQLGGDMRVLAVGLGNRSMTPDAVGPDTLCRLTVTRHLREHDEALFVALGCCELSALTPGVLGQTGMESGSC